MTQLYVIVGRRQMAVREEPPRPNKDDLAAPSNPGAGAAVASLFFAKTASKTSAFWPSSAVPRESLGDTQRVKCALTTADVLRQTSPHTSQSASIADVLTQTWLICRMKGHNAVDRYLQLGQNPIHTSRSSRGGCPGYPSPILPPWPQSVQPSRPRISMVMDTSVRGGPGTRKMSKPDAVYVPTRLLTHSRSLVV